MKLLSSSLQGYSNTQSSTIGWKEISCSKSTTAQNQVINFLKLSITTGNPEFYFITFTDESVSHGSVGFYSAANGIIGKVKGYKVNTAGIISSDGAMVDLIPYAQGWNLVSYPWSSTTTDAGNLYFRTANSSDYSIVHTHVNLCVFSERIDLITLSCI